ncbi:hypothetical protein [Nocardia sp. NPDC050717]|uniref:hypothetical protein n=1 Tax=Nocardia sp. NPDC050717 TaxID=3157221 RepID=UPI0033C4F3E6
MFGVLVPVWAGPVVGGSVVRVAAESAGAETFAPAVAGAVLVSADGDCGVTGGALAETSLRRAGDPVSSRLCLPTRSGVPAEPSVVGAVCAAADGDPMVPIGLSAASSGFRVCSGLLSVGELVPGRAAVGVLDALVSVAASSGIDHAPGTPLVGEVADETPWPTAGSAVRGDVVCAPSPDVVDGFCCAVGAGAVSRGGTAGGFAAVFGRGGASTESAEYVGSAAVAWCDVGSLGRGGSSVDSAGFRSAPSWCDVGSLGRGGSSVDSAGFRSAPSWCDVSSLGRGGSSVGGAGFRSASSWCDVGSLGRGGSSVDGVGLASVVAGRVDVSARSAGPVGRAEVSRGSVRRGGASVGCGRAGGSGSGGGGGRSGSWR